MQDKTTFLFVLIASIKFVYSGPIGGGILPGGSPLSNIPDVGKFGGGRGGGINVNEDGLLHGLNGILDESLCSIGLGCDGCEGLLEGLQPPMGKTVNSLGLGVDCGGSGQGNGKKPGSGIPGVGNIGGGRGGGNLLDGSNGKLDDSLCSIGLGCNDSGVILQGLL